MGDKQKLRRGIKHMRLGTPMRRQFDHRPSIKVERRPRLSRSSFHLSIYAHQPGELRDVAVRRLVVNVGASRGRAICQHQGVDPESWQMEQPNLLVVIAAIGDRGAVIVPIVGVIE